VNIGQYLAKIWTRVVSPFLTHGVVSFMPRQDAYCICICACFRCIKFPGLEWIACWASYINICMQWCDRVSTCTLIRLYWQLS